MLDFTEHHDQEVRDRALSALLGGHDVKLTKTSFVILGDPIRDALIILRSMKFPDYKRTVRDLPSWFNTIIGQARKNSTIRGKLFTLTLDECFSLHERVGEKCEISGIEFDLENPKIKGKRRPFAASLDRIDSAKGYTFDNVRVVCSIVNQAMNEWGEDPLRILVKAMASK